MIETIRRFAFWFILIPVSVVLMAFALSNRQRVFLSLNPFGIEGTEIPLFFACVMFFIGGALVGGFLAWNSQRPWRTAVKRQAREIDTLRNEIVDLKRGPAPPPVKPDWQILPPL